MKTKIDYLDQAMLLLIKTLETEGPTSLVRQNAEITMACGLIALAVELREIKELISLNTIKPEAMK